MGSTAPICACCVRAAAAAVPSGVCGVKMRSWFYAALVLAVAGWLALFLSSSAILVWGQTVESRQAESRAYLRCWYFTGTGIFETYWHTTSGAFGMAACPWLESL
jgi:hypothetical protein